MTLAGVFQNRFPPALRRAKEAVESGELGALVVADAAVKWFRSAAYYDSGGWRGTRDMDGGVMLNQAVHDIDRLQWLTGGVDWFVCEHDEPANPATSIETGAAFLAEL